MDCCCCVDDDGRGIGSVVEVVGVGVVGFRVVVGEGGVNVFILGIDVDLGVVVGVL